MTTNKWTKVVSGHYAKGEWTVMLSQTGWWIVWKNNERMARLDSVSLKEAQKRIAKVSE